MSGPRAAGIDCGTNSIRLLVADVEAGGSSDGRLMDVHREMRVVRLGQDVDGTGRLAAEAIERTRVALVDYAEIIRQTGTRTIRMVATSATRDAENRDDFVRMVRAVLGVDPEVISGIEEAELSFRGAVQGLPNVSGRLLVTDIGGGSTELVLGDVGPAAAAGQRLRAHSMNIGCVRMTERHLRDDPPTVDQVAAARADIEAAIDAAALDVPLTTATTFIGVAGTVTTMAALVLGLTAYDAEAIHGSTMSAAEVRAVTGRLLAMTRAERAAEPVMHPGRVDVIGGGALILQILMERTGAATVIASEHDILDGITASAVERPPSFD